MPPPSHKFVNAMKFTRLLPAMLLGASTLAASGQDRVISFPDVSPYLTLACDLHMHTVFSDGSVWPDIRVQEALRDGLDAIATTDHLEYLPHRDDIPLPDHNRAYQVASQQAEGEPLLVINGSEVTRSMPPGHANAIFLEDSNRLLLDDPLDVFREAQRQNAFIFWNHPNWTSQRSDGVATLTDMHRMLIAENLLHGIEIANENTYSDEALAIALEHDLTLLGTSDIHGLVDWEFEVPAGGHRPVTLVFATERTKEAIKEALFARRTAVWYRNTLIGRSPELMPLLSASLKATTARYGGGTTVLAVTLANESNAHFMLRNRSAYTFHADADIIQVPPHGETTIDVKTIEATDSLTLEFEVLNALTAPGVHPVLTLEIIPEEN